MLLYVLIMSWLIIMVFHFGSPELIRILVPPLAMIWVAYVLLISEEEWLITTVLGLTLCSIFAVRYLLIMSGVYKSPILQRFERYGEEEAFFYPIPGFLFWMGAFLVIGNQWLSRAFQVQLPIELLSTLLVVMGYAVYYVMTHPDKMMAQWLYDVFFYPRWLFDLQERTTRLERRRIAYMWMRLPFKARLTYNSSDQAFLQWADFVILSTMM